MKQDSISPSGKDQTASNRSPGRAALWASLIAAVLLVTAVLPAEYGIDWTLLAAISVAESSGGKQMCNFNPFGWGSCRSGVGDFSSISEAIDYVSMNLGGHNPRTAGAYSGNSEADLWSYNGTVDPLYPGKVMRYMRDIMETPLP